MPTKKNLNTAALEKIANMVEAADNALHASKLPLPDSLHVDGLSSTVEKIRNELRAAYKSLTGDDPWAGQW